MSPIAILEIVIKKVIQMPMLGIQVSCLAYFLIQYHNSIAKPILTPWCRTLFEKPIVAQPVNVLLP
jgi:hypothetical protein